MFNRSNPQRPHEGQLPSACHANAMAPPTPQSQDPAGRRLRWRSTDLLGTAQEIEIEHGQVIYRLKLTSLGKLILTK